MKELPNELKLNGFEFLSERQQSEIVDDINNFLANTYGFCNNGFQWKISIKLKNIDWDTSE